MCSESRSENWHRTKPIAEALVAVGQEVLHISEDGRLLAQSQAMSRVGYGQLDLFERTRNTSRKKYPIRKDTD